MVNDLLDYSFLILINCFPRIDFKGRLAHQHQQGQWRDLKYSTNPARNCTKQWPNSGESPARCLISAGVSTVKVTTSTVSMNRTNKKKRTVVWVPVRPCSYRKWCTELPVSFCKPLFVWIFVLLATIIKDTGVTSRRLKYSYIFVRISKFTICQSDGFEEITSKYAKMQHWRYLTA